MTEIANYFEVENILNEIVEDGSSIGVHMTKGAANMSGYELYSKKILNEGIYAKSGVKRSSGIVSTFCLCGQKNVDFDIQILADWSWANFSEGSCKIIIALPEIIETSNGQKHYMGKYPAKFDTFGHKKSIGGPYDHMEIIPVEFIVGCILLENNNPKKISINPKYIGLKDKKEKQLFYDNNVWKGFTINDGLVNALKEEISRDNDSPEYYKQYIDYYDLLSNKFSK